METYPQYSGNTDLHTFLPPRLQPPFEEKREYENKPYEEKPVISTKDYLKSFSQSLTYSGFFTDMDGSNGGTQTLNESFELPKNLRNQEIVKTNDMELNNNVASEYDSKDNDEDDLLSTFKVYNY